MKLLHAESCTLAWPVHFFPTDLPAAALMVCQYAPKHHAPLELVDFYKCMSYSQILSLAIQEVSGSISPDAFASSSRHSVSIKAGPYGMKRLLGASALSLMPGSVLDAACNNMPS